MTRSPILRHSPRWTCSSASGSHSTVRRRGQNALRPPIVSSAGSSVRPAASTHATPIAETGPSELIERVSAMSSTSIESATVRPLAKIAGPERRTARAIASCLS